MKKLFENFWIKIIALIFGLLLWFHVATEKIYIYQINLPISEIILDNNLTLAATPPESLMVTVSATGKRLMRKKWRRQGLKVIATQYGTGRQTISLTTSNTVIAYPANEISLDEINFPPVLTLNIDELDERTVPIEADVKLEADDGFAVSGMYIQSSREVRITGPKSVINKIPVIFTEQKKLSGLRNSFDLTLPLATPVGHGITLQPDSVVYAIEVVPVKTRTFLNIPIAVYNISPDTDYSLEPASVKVELTGPPSEIELLNRSVLVASTDYTLMDSTGRAPIKVDCPPKFKIKAVSDSMVQILLR